MRKMNANFILFICVSFRKEYEKRAELRRIRGMRVADFLAEHDNPAEHYMATDTPVREAGGTDSGGPWPKGIEQAVLKDNKSSRCRENGRNQGFS